MNWFYLIPQKFKTAILLMLIVSAVLITSFWVKSSVASMNESFISFYKDRLIPANELFHISDIMYQKRLLLIDYIDQKLSKEKVKVELVRKNQLIDSILVEYDKTYLVAEESKSLIIFKAKIAEYNKTEEAFLLGQIDSSTYENELVPQFKEVREELLTLSQIQTVVGKELLSGSEEISAHTSTIHYLQLGMILILIMVVQAIILSAKSIIPKKPQKFELN